nr:hypothetical protein [Pyrinomonadaceae bacterium]
IREGLRLLQQRDEIQTLKLKALQKEIQLGIDDLEAGRFSDGRATMATMKERLLKIKGQNG